MSPPARVDLSKPVRIHVVGVGGAGMSAIATALAGMGHTVTGSDLKESPVLERLRAAGVGLSLGHDEGQVAGADAVTYSTAVPPDNLEVRAARERGIRVLTRAQTLASIAATRRSVAVAGTHGKTTTASMLALVLVEAGVHPSYIVGGELNETGTGAVWDRGEWLVVEADESDASFLELRPEMAVVTNLEPDHLEWYGSFEALERAFAEFLARCSGARLACSDYPSSLALAEKFGAGTFGTVKGSTYRVTRTTASRTGIGFDLRGPEGRLGRVNLPVPGRYNALNAGAALAAALTIGCDFETGVRALSRFGGVARRFEFRGEFRGVTFVDDYAHLPTEVAQMVAAASDGGWSRVVCVFQPHRYSRTAALWADFAHAFDGADVVVLTDVYPAGEPPRPGVSGALVQRAVGSANPNLEVHYLPTRQELVERVPGMLRSGDVCLTLGAGDLTSLPDELMRQS